MLPVSLTSEVLKEKHSSLNVFGDDFSVRTSRAISWIRSSEEATADDMKIIPLWIAFNACYSIRPDANSLDERKRQRAFLEKLIAVDKLQRIYELFWTKYSGPIRVLMSNKFIFSKYWAFHRGEVSNWKEDFDRENNVFQKLLMQPDRSVRLIEIVLGRLYQMRNQLVHGGATYKSKVNRDQIRDSLSFLSAFVPLVVQILLENPTQDWGAIRYPYIQDG